MQSLRMLSLQSGCVFPDNQHGRHDAALLAPFMLKTALPAYNLTLGPIQALWFLVGYHLLRIPQPSQPRSKLVLPGHVGDVAALTSRII